MSGMIFSPLYWTVFFYLIATVKTFKNIQFKKLLAKNMWNDKNNATLKKVQPHINPV